MRRREFITLLGGATVVWPLGVRAQQPGTLARIGAFAEGGTNPITAGGYRAFLDELSKLGFIQGRKVLTPRS